ncbi:MAG: cysteine synthase [Glaciecola sp.]|jgi:cysteine synthase
MSMASNSIVHTSALTTVGNTPLVRLGSIVPEGAADVLVKLEWFSPTGSYKDRMALAMIENAERRGELKPGMTVVEYTGGSTGSSLAYICAVKGYRFQVVTSDVVAIEKRRTMAAFGAEMTVLESGDGKNTPKLIRRMIATAAGRAMTRRLARQEGLLVGISSGVNVAGAIELAQELGRGHTVVTVAVDTGLKYLAGTVFEI